MPTPSMAPTAGDGDRGIMVPTASPAPVAPVAAPTTGETLKIGRTRANAEEHPFFVGRGCHLSAGYDTPQTHDSFFPPKPFCEDSAARIAQLILGASVRREKSSWLYRTG